MVTLHRKIKVVYDQKSKDALKWKPKQMDVTKDYLVIMTKNYSLPGLAGKEIVHYGIKGENGRLLFVSAENCIILFG